MNTRMQITLPVRDHARVAAKAAENGVSIAEYLRRLVRRDLDEDSTPPPADVTELFGLGDSGGGDIAVHKQRYVAEAIMADKRPPP